MLELKFGVYESAGRKDGLQHKGEFSHLSQFQLLDQQLQLIRKYLLSEDVSTCRNLYRFAAMINLVGVPSCHVIQRNLERQLKRDRLTFEKRAYLNAL